MRRRRPTYALIAMAVLVMGACQPARNPVPPAQLVAERKQREVEKGLEVLEACREASCRVLTFRSASLPDYTVLNELTHVTAIEFSFTSFENLEEIAKMRQLEGLSVSARKIRNVSVLENFENLKSLIVYSQNQEDVVPVLRRMPQLKYLATNLSSDSSIRFVKAMPQLKTIKIFGRQLADLSPVSGHPTLENLIIQATLPNDLSPLLDLPNLRRLEVYDTIDQHKDLDVIKKLQAKGIKLELIASVIY